MVMWRLCKFSITSTVRQMFFAEKYFDSLEPRIHGPRNYPRIFMWPLSLINVGPRSIIHLQCFKMVSHKRRNRLLQARCTMECLCRPLILQ